MREKKQAVRSDVLLELNGLPIKEHRRLSEQIALHLFKQSYWEQAQTVALTVSRYPELDTTMIMDKAWKQGKAIVLPRINKTTKHMSFYQVDDRTQLEETVYGLQEPIPSVSVRVEPEDIHIMIVPGVAFTKEGARLGLGGGYYDRYLPRYTGLTVALLFSCQLVDSIPMESHDYRMDKMIGPGGILR